jgi:D-beta-D-heptose 7-phosphate kinase/D-beta-D-heptose 1-phosphate adenosyltransferase
MLDEYVYGTIERISPEAPVGILDWRERKIGLGGAANVASNLAHLGCRVFLAGIVGSDQAGEELVRAVRDLGIDSGGVVTDTQRPTTVKTRIVAHGHQVLRMDRESRSHAQDSLLKMMLSYVQNCILSVDGIILSDYIKGV